MIMNASGVKGTQASLGNNAEESFLGAERPGRRYADSGGTLTVNPSLTQSSNLQWLKSRQFSLQGYWFDRAASIPSPLNDI